MTLIVPGQEEWWVYYRDHPYDPPNFKLRSAYLKSWLTTYITHRDEIEAGADMPKLLWRHTAKAPFIPFKSLHRCDTRIIECNCEIAILLQQMFRIGYEEAEDELEIQLWFGAYNLDVIYNTYRRQLRVQR